MYSISVGSFANSSSLRDKIPPAETFFSQFLFQIQCHERYFIILRIVENPFIQSEIVTPPVVIFHFFSAYRPDSIHLRYRHPDIAETVFESSPARLQVVFLDYAVDVWFPTDSHGEYILNVSRPRKKNLFICISLNYLLYAERLLHCNPLFFAFLDR